MRRGLACLVRGHRWRITARWSDRVPTRFGFVELGGILRACSRCDVDHPDNPQGYGPGMRRPTPFLRPALEAGSS